MEPNKVDTVRDWPVLKSKHEDRSFLGLCSHYRGFEEGFATVAKPLHELTENLRNFHWPSSQLLLPFIEPLWKSTRIKGEISNKGCLKRYAVYSESKDRTTPLHPQSDGMIDRFNKILEQHLLKVVDENQTDWDQRIPLFLMGCRSSVHDTIGMTPAKFVFVREIRLPGDLMLGSPKTQSQEPQNYSSQLEKQMRELNHLVRGRLKIASDKMKTRYDIRSSSVGFQEGDQVFLFNTKLRRDRTPKLQSNWEGSYTVKK